MDDDPEPLHPDDESMLNTAEAGIERELDMAQSMAAAMDAMVKKIRGD
jgi:hypothetical protein